MCKTKTMGTFIFLLFYFFVFFTFISSLFLSILFIIVCAFFSLSPSYCSSRNQDPGFASVGDDAVKHAAHYVSQTTIRVPLFSSSFSAVGHSWWSSYRSFVQGEEHLLRTRGLIVSRGVHGEAPKRQLPSLLCLEVTTPENKLTH